MIRYGIIIMSVWRSFVKRSSFAKKMMRIMVVLYLMLPTWSMPLGLDVNMD